MLACRAINRKRLQTEVHDMIAADCTVVNDNIYRNPFILARNRRKRYETYPTPTMPPHSTACRCIGLKNLETVEIGAYLFNFESLLQVIFLGCYRGNVYIYIHISHDLSVCGVVGRRVRRVTTHVIDSTRDIGA